MPEMPRTTITALVLATALLLPAGTSGTQLPPPTASEGTVMTFSSGRLCTNDPNPNATRCNRDVFTSDPADGSSAPLAQFHGVDDDPAVSPDGEQIVFSSDRVCDDGNGGNKPGCQQNRDIYIVDSDGSNLRRLTDNPRPDQRPRWSPLGEEIVFHRERPGTNGRSDIILRDVNAMTGEGETVLTSGDRDFQPSFSPSGHQVAFTRVELPDNPTPGNLNLIGANTYIYDFCELYPPLRVRGPFGDSPGHPDLDQAPTWRPDPTALASSNPCDWDWRSEGELAFGSLRDCANPAAAIAAMSADDCSYELYKMPTGNAPVSTRGYRQQQQPPPGVVRLTRDMGCTAGPTPSAEPTCPQDLDPTYSPDGTQIAFWSDRPEPGQMRSGSSAGSQWPKTEPMRSIRRFVLRATSKRRTARGRRGARSYRQAPFPPQEEFQNSEDNDVYLMNADTGMAGGLTNLTPDGNNGESERFDDQAPVWAARAESSNGGGPPSPASQYVTAQIVKFRDDNANGQRDGAEPPLANVRFFADVNRNDRQDPGESSTITGADGKADLPLLRSALRARVIEVKPDGFVCTFPNPCHYDVPTLNANQRLVFGNAPSATVADDRCARTAGLGRVAVAGVRGGKLRIQFQRRVERGVNVEIFRVSRRRTVVDATRVASFRNRRSSFTWAGKGVGDGYFVATYKVRGGGGTDVRRVAFRRADGRFSKRPPYARRTICKTVRLLSLGSPVFGGTSEKPLRLRFSLNQTAEVAIEIRRRGRVVERFAAAQLAADRVYRRRFDAARAPAGPYRVSLVAVVPGEKTQRVVLQSRRL